LRRGVQIANLRHAAGVQPSPEVRAFTKSIRQSEKSRCSAWRPRKPPPRWPPRRSALATVRPHCASCSMARSIGVVAFQGRAPAGARHAASARSRDPRRAKSARQGQGRVTLGRRAPILKAWCGLGPSIAGKL
jgi:hypothetical protein